MDIEATADVTREVGRHLSDVADRPGQSVNGDAARQAADAISARAERSIETPVAPVGGPEYTGRA